VDVDEHGAYDLMRGVMSTNAQARDAQEGMSAFLEKRMPEWRGE
jgi:enoyl-CoA hydratase/carnithine racemase